LLFQLLYPNKDFAEGQNNSINFVTTIIIFIIRNNSKIDRKFPYKTVVMSLKKKFDIKTLFVLRIFLASSTTRSAFVSPTAREQQR